MNTELRKFAKKMIVRFSKVLIVKVDLKGFGLSS
jgi:hypothetical protein